MPPPPRKSLRNDFEQRELMSPPTVTANEQQRFILDAHPGPKSMPQVNPRKRATPGTMPTNQLGHPSISYPYQPTAPIGTQALDWNYEGGNNGNHDVPNGYSFNPYPQQQAMPPETSTQLARRPTGHRPSVRGDFRAGDVESWAPVQAHGLPTQQPTHETWVEDLGELKERASAVKRESQQRRKVIPPFIKKLRSFLDNPHNDHLIRWSDNGESFIVVDEDAFAKTLIPELFKHNNYASFVRQLNMYGFHKQVGLSDNSMRASEKKTKTPSEYSNRFFKKDDAELMWLIQKPKPTSKSKKQTAGNPDDDAEEFYDPESPTHQTVAEDVNGALARGHRQPLMISQEEAPVVSSISKEQEAALKDTLARIQRNQQNIAESVRQLQRERDQQALAFQEMHKKHEHSINAILTFLATIYNRSLEGANGQILADMFSSPHPRESSHQGNVVEMDNFEPTSTPTNAQMQQLVRRQPLLLKAPPSIDISSGSPMTAASPATIASSPDLRSRNLAGTTIQGPNSQYLSRSDTPITTPSPAHQPVDRRPEVTSHSNGTNGNTLSDQDILSFIQSRNNNESFLNNRMDFPQALSHLQTSGGNSPLTPAQKNTALQSLTNGTKNSSAYPNVNNEDLQALERSLHEQGSQIANLSRGLSPLSPSGSIPGLSEQQYMGVPGDNDILGDLDQVFTEQDYFGNTTGNDPNGDFDFVNDKFDFTTAPHEDFEFTGTPQFTSGHGFTNDFDIASQNGDGVRSIETIPSSEATSPANTTDDVLENGGLSPRKRQRKG